MRAAADAAPPRTDAARPIDILLVEDTQSDAMLLERALSDSHLPHRLHRLRDGAEVMPWLKRTAGLGALPDVILLDLGMPHMDGFELLAELAAASPLLRAVPIVILTGYEDFDYIRKSYNLCLPAYLTKPCQPADIARVLGGLGRNGENGGR